ncbi:hypothetical protein [Pseudomonas xanthosomatis]|uniref:hypothetical protein n=1 Tax=Pseudomonas xanthosomatis TaxID=2842356 RepID=UPI0035118EB9
MGGAIFLISLGLWVGAWVLIVRRRKGMGLVAANLIGAFAGFVLFSIFAGVFMPELTPEQRQAQAESQRKRDEQKAAEKAQEQAREAEIAKTKDRSIMAAIICSNYVEQSLKSPKSADFPFEKAAGGSRILGEQKYLIRSYVDAQNSYGAQLRNWYDCTIQYRAGNDGDPRSWNLIKLKFSS